MTSHDHNQVMSKVGIADLKAHLSEHLRKVRRGRSLTVLDRDTPVARIVPYDSETPLEVRRATRKPGDLRLPGPLPRPTDSLAVLLEDRASR
jgi:prevent-host-death family protein